MAIKDKTKWNKKYNNTPALLQNREPSIKLQNIIKNMKSKKAKALDIACGAGKNSIYMAKASLEVDALDISEVAVDTIKQKNITNIKTQCIDLEGYIPTKNSYDLVVMTNYLDRVLIPHLIKALKQDGILFIETYMHHDSNTKPNSNPDFLLQKDELKSFIDNKYKILEYDEFDNDKNELYKMRKQSIIIQKIKVR